MNKTVKVLDNSGSLSETDLQLISGTDLLLVMVTNGGTELDWQKLMLGVTGLYHIRRIDTDKLYQIWFELPMDIDRFEKNLLMAKLSDTTENE
jgi:hypothetical protein